MSAYKEVFKRAEIKYLLKSDQFDELMPYLEKIASVDAYGLSKINNIYFDTMDYRLIRTSIDKPVYKEKLRLRTYGDTGDDTNSFIEIKKKYAGIVYKRRISGRYADTFNYLTGQGRPVTQSQVGREIESFLKTYPGLHPAMVISYDRVALAGKEDPDFRVTFDTNIRWSTLHLDLREMDKGRPIIAPDEHLMEIKVTNAIPMELSKTLSRLQIFPVSFSKYGRGYAEMLRIQAENSSVARRTQSLVHFKNDYTGKGVYAYV